MVHKFFPYHFMIEIKNFRCFGHMRIISRVFGGYFGPFLDLFVKETQKKGTFFKIEKSNFWPVILWGWLSWVAMAKILVLVRFRVLRIKCLLLKNVRYLIWKVIWSGANLSGSDTPKLTFDSKIHYLVQNPEDWDQKKKFLLLKLPLLFAKVKSKYHETLKSTIVLRLSSNFE